MLQLEQRGQVGSKRRSLMVETARFTELVEAVDENDQKKLDSLLRQLRESGHSVPSILEQNIVGQTPLLHYVCKTHRQNLDMVKYLLDQGCNINTSSQEGTPLLIACRVGAVELVKMLLDNGAQIVTEDEMDVEKSPFYVASLMGHYEILKALMLHQPSMSDIIDPLGEM
ncbi:hypothetical protein KUTeg_017830 [Tegillarca granosa]|uniref:Uncharacterized protein n=1 Tax=Tegillarca granosa TaxID=220873 RepID=A0ABQ9EJY4_TEGGR|nr:hypothetical protein KUTeg_017830 [Tegillarca granosa]